MYCKTAAILALGLVLAAPATQAASVKADAWCVKPGLARAPRQTVVIIDEAHVVANPAKGVAPQNRAWSRFVGQLVDPARIEQGRLFAPRERLTVMMAMKDGSEPRLLFTGCLPFYSAAEKAALARKAGSMGTAAGSYFGAGPVQAAAKDMERFRTRLAAALIDGAKPSALSRTAMSGPFQSSGLLASLRRAPLADLSLGTPRVVLYSNLSRFAAPARDVAGARRAGFALARRAPVDFKRAEVYVAGAVPSRSELGREYFTAWLLGSGGALRGWTHTGLAAVDPYPAKVEVFSGVIRYGDVDAPTRVRLATTADGEIVNSWIAVQNDVESATPFSGEIVTLPGGARHGRSNGRGLGQLWSDDPDEAPEFAADLPFAGLRRLEFNVSSTGSMTGKVSDPLVTVIRGSKVPYVGFRLTRTEALF